MSDQHICDRCYEIKDTKSLRNVS